MIKVCLLLLFLSDVAYGQKNPYDSLELELSSAKADTQKLEILKQLTDVAFGIDMEKSLDYSREGVKLADEIGDKNWQPKFYEMEGRMHANLFHLDSALYFFTKVIEVYPDYLSYNDVNIYAEENPVVPDLYPMGGYQMLVRAEVFRGRYRKSFENPSGFVPGKIEEVKFELPSVAHQFKKGHRIMVQIQSSWFPLVDRNPQQFVDIYHCDEKDFIKSDIKIYHDAKNVSKIILPVLK